MTWTCAYLLAPTVNDHFKDSTLLCFAFFKDSTLLRLALSAKLYLFSKKSLVAKFSIMFWIIHIFIILISNTFYCSWFQSSKQHFFTPYIWKKLMKLLEKNHGLKGVFPLIFLSFSFHVVCACYDVYYMFQGKSLWREVHSIVILCQTLNIKQLNSSGYRPHLLLWSPSKTNLSSESINLDDK